MAGAMPTTSPTHSALHAAGSSSHSSAAHSSASYSLHPQARCAGPWPGPSSALFAGVAIATYLLVDPALIAERRPQSSQHRNLGQRPAQRLRPHQRARRARRRRSGHALRLVAAASRWRRRSSRSSSTSPRGRCTSGPCAPTPSSPLSFACKRTAVRPSPAAAPTAGFVILAIAGGIAFNLATPLMLGSLWALLPGIVGAGAARGAHRSRRPPASHDACPATQPTPNRCAIG